MKRSWQMLPRLLCAGLLAAGAAASAADFPVRPVRMLVPYAPGGATDIIARILAARLNEAWGQPVIVDNRPGASGNIALEAAAKASPDGYTVLVGNVSTNAINETTFAHTLRIKPSRDFVGVTNLIEIPHIFAVNPGLAATSIKQLVDLAKAPGASFNYASAGIGSYPHLDMVMFARSAGITMTHVPYKGGAGQMIPALIGGEVQVMFINLASTLEQVRAGRIRALATTMPQRVAELPNVPTMAESGFPGIGTNAWNGLFAPAAVPKPVLAAIFGKVVAVMDRPDAREQLGKQMMTVVLNPSPEAYTRFVRAETEKWAKVVKDNDIKVE
ncbi:MAG TPA: tripartite tricarboxylate transporter substrate binding protein [Burkholderiales bacterium]|nr:tripartite tricarboxylate transporter substrate binding protein [Burkholderiales bacterium]